MSALPTRKFTLLDAMILLAATAIAIAWSREMMSGVVIFRPIPRSSLSFREPEIWGQLLKRFPLSTWFQLGVRGAVPFLATWTVTILGLSLRQPRQQFGEVTRQPGVAASCVGTMAMAIDASWFTAHYLASPDSWDGLSILTTVNSADVSFAVAGAWLMLASLGLWQAERGWLDRSGRFLGMAWIGVAVILRGQEILQKFHW
jgi:hypothetical protein